MEDRHTLLRRTGVMIAVVAASAAAGAAIDRGVFGGDSRSARQGSVTYPAEVRALGIDTQMADGALMLFGNEECQAARSAHADDGAALLKFKADHVAAAYRTNDQVAIEGFRTLFIATAHLLCPDVETPVRASSRPLL